MNDQEPPTSLSSVLGSREVLSLAFGAMIGWGWVILSGQMIEQAGSLGSMLAFLAGAVMVGLVALTYAELTTALPRAGGELGFTFRAFGPAVSWLCGWALLLAYVAVSAFEAVALPYALSYLYPDLFQSGFLYEVAGSKVYASWLAAGVAGALLIAYLNWRGVQLSALVQTTATLAMLAIGLSFFAGSNVAGSTEHLEPWFTDGRGFFAVLVMTPFLFLGFDVIPQAAEEIRVPARQLGRLMLFSVALATLWYVLVQWGVGLGLPESERLQSPLPTADAMARVMGGAWAGKLLVGAGLLGILTSWNSFFVGGTRLIFAMARGRMLPAFLGRLHPSHQTPSNAILFVLVLSLAASFFGREALVWIVNAGSLATVTAYLLVAVAFLQLRRAAPELPRPFRTPAGMLVGLGAVLCTATFIAFYLPGSAAPLVWPHEWLILIAWSVLGAVFYLYQRRHNAGLTAAAQGQLILGEFAATEERSDRSLGGGPAESNTSRLLGPD